jgi:hypothetical protein
MKDKRFFVGMLVLMLVFGLIVTGCDNGTTDEEPNLFLGTWIFDKGGENERHLIISQNGWTLTNNGENYLRGTYTYMDNKITCLTRDYWDDEASPPVWDSIENILENSDEWVYTLSENGQILMREDDREFIKK